MTASSNPALVLVDLQRDFLDRPGLVPEPRVLCERAAALLDHARERGIPVVHVQTRIRPDGSDQMPHWRSLGITACVDGTPGAAPPPELEPNAGEPVFEKQFYSGFSSGALDEWLRAHNVERVIVAGVYSHGCVRATVLDAYERGYDVWVADDAIGSTEPVHDAATRSWLDGRAARFLLVDAIGVALGQSPQGSAAPEGPSAVRAAAMAAAAAQPAWGRTPVDERLALLLRWADRLESDAPRLAALVVDEVGKPQAAADDEVRRAVAHVRSAAALLEQAGNERPLDTGVEVRNRPIGVVGLVMPWNNPLALPIGKLAPALAFGNAAVFKPAPEAVDSARAILESLAAVAAPPGLVNLVFGGRETAEAICDDPDVDAVSVTGSIAAGRTIAARCARTTKPVQAELGGNNAAIVLADADLDTVVPPLVQGAFSFAGQRCTAIRRFVVERPAVERFTEIARRTIDDIVVGDPHDPRTAVGPMISVRARDRVLRDINDAVAAGARLVAGGQVPAGLESGAWLAPTLLVDVDPASAVAQTETFGPLAVMIAVDDLDEALAVANGVPNGLVLAVCSADAGVRARVLDEGLAGIVQVGPGPLAVHPEAPFGGWKASGMGPPEHGEWDLAFYTRPQAVYGNGPC